MAQSIRRIPVLLLCAGLGACSTLPSAGPVQKDILGTPVEERDFAVYPVTRANLPQFASWPKTGGATGQNWLRSAPGGASHIIAPGDRLDVVVWDNEENSLLTSGLQRSVNLSGVEVAPDGSIFMPYLENVHVAGMTPESARRAVQTQLTTLMPSAQVQLNATAGRKNSVDLVGGVSRPGIYPLPDRDFSILALLSAGGGTAPGIANPQVRLMRGGQRYNISLEQLYASPSLDTTLRGGDKVFIEEDRRTFLSLGAAASQRLHPFPRDDISALDAMAITAGVDANRGNPRGILILREYARADVRANAIGGPERDRAVFTLDLTTADGLFSAGKFQINPDDVVLVTEASVNSVRTILQILGIGAGTVRTIDLTAQ